MTNLQNAPLEKTNIQVQETKDYSMFTILKGNRAPNDLHVQRLVKSFEKKYLMSPMLVNEHYQIIDGQHRYLACKKLGLPLRYIMVNGYGLSDVQILNSNSSNWNKYDYLQGYCDLGAPAYIEMKKFMQSFPDLGIAASEQILTNTVGGVNNRNNLMNGRGKVKNFEEGRLEIPNLKLSYENAEKVMMFKPYYDGYNRAVFVAALISLFKNENYVHAEMISKLANQPSALTHCSNTTQYKLLLEDIYNYRRREKLNLRY
jgi:hypothetical protein